MFSSSLESDCLFIEALEVSALVGLYPRERLAPQRLVLDLALGLDLSRSAKSDRIEDTVDYDALVETISRRLAASDYALLEALGEAICQDCLTNFRANWIRIRLRKPGLFADAKGIGIELFRRRGNAGTKKDCRRLVLTRRRPVNDDRRAAEAAMFSRLFELPEFIVARTVFAYVGVAHEPDTMPLLHHVLEIGKKLTLPQVDLIRQQMILYRVARLEIAPAGDLTPGYKGILEPNASCLLAEGGDIDLAIVPGVAFDQSGRRLGRGGGYYDRWLARHPRACRISLIFDEQLIESVPADDHDQPVDILITPTRTIRCPR